MKKEVRFIINPISGVGKKSRLPKLIKNNVDTLKYRPTIFFTKYAGHATEIATDAAMDGCAIVAIVGGDGSVNEVGKALIDTKTAMAIIPAGSGNGIARHLQIPLRLKKAIQLINNGKITAMDTILLNQHCAIGVSGFGFDAWIAKKFEEYPRRGLWSYVKLVFLEYKKYKGIDIAINGKTYSNLYFCSIANTSQFGNGFKVSPESKTDDTLVEIVCVKKTSFLRMINLAISSLFGTIHRSPQVDIISLPYGQIKLSDGCGHIDGDPQTFESLLVDIKVAPKSLLIVIPSAK